MDEKKDTSSPGWGPHHASDTFNLPFMFKYMPTHVKPRPHYRPVASVLLKIYNHHNAFQKSSDCRAYMSNLSMNEISEIAV